MKKILVLFYLLTSIVVFGQVEVGEVSKLLGTSNGRIISSEKAKEVRPLASVTKMMTVLLTYDAINRGEISMDDMVEIPAEISKIGGSRLWMSTNDRLTVRDLIKATAIYSANNAAYSLAYYVGHGDIDKFVKMMNKRAKELGMKNTRYYSPAGLPPHMTGTKMDVSTVEDVYKLSLELVKNHDYMKIASTKIGSTRKGTQKFPNRNKLLGKEGIYGIKTGHHDQAGYNISIVSKKNGIVVIDVVFGASTEKERDTIVLSDLRDFHSEYGIINIISKGDEIGTIKIRDGKKNQLTFYSPKTFQELLRKDIEIKKELKIVDNLEAPLKSGTKLGEYKIFVDGKLYLKVNLTLKESIDKI